MISSRDSDISTHNQGVIVAVSLVTASAQQPERTEVREDCEHCPEPE
ncbi:hypothetical protein CIT292_10553 [Citrobacter youngae ATCC 29220]|uniref:Uncharacterized protein n=1 Tax=Citrobacter youngae ATCC 29220 TaxID=500640 RepID=D4BJ37_9ENTR|nr:hypothetical protein CIT292_10553 [Citrobacter youngae ATCC 29220]